MSNTLRRHPSYDHPVAEYLRERDPFVKVRIKDLARFTAPSDMDESLTEDDKELLIWPVNRKR